jgi:glycosyltransferase involved in cell wall biosynthesis
VKICMITSTYKLSESDVNVPFLVESVRRLVRSGASVHVFAPSYEGCKSHEVDGVPVHRFRYFFKRWENLTHNQGAPNRIRNPFYLLVAFFYIVFGLLHAVHFCRKHHFDVIHVHWPFPHGIWGYAASRLTGAPMVLTFHGAEILLCKKYFFVKYFLQQALERAAAVACNSNFTAAEVSRLTRKPLHVIPFGCTVEGRLRAKDHHKPVKDILFVGRLITRKGLDYLLRAVPLLNAKMPIKLHIVGDGNKASAWKALAAELKLGDTATFHGVVSNEDLARYYSAADVFVLPAIVDERGDTEGLGVVLVEAISFKTPVVACNVGGIPDVIIDEQTGLLVPEKDPAALAKAVERVLRDSELAARLAHEGLRYANDYFDWDRITRLWLDIYRGVLGLAPQTTGANRSTRRSKVGTRNGCQDGDGMQDLEWANEKRV